MLDEIELKNRFTYHAPKDQQPEMYEKLRAKGLDLAKMMARFCPEGRERSLAITKLEEAIMWANASIARQR